MNYDEKYHDIDGNDCTLEYLIRYEREWTANCIRSHKKRIEELEAVCEEWIDKQGDGTGDEY